ncbi:hypothetical protein BGX38DRAFT_1249591 [Terfezia claveryi]|nr:hypothetical protein BGX38DRAFT_1249591 [Terfezia claveryi]
MCLPTCRRRPPSPSAQPPLNILLTNGRFPVSIDLARQFTRAGHSVYVVDPMHYHVCRFSNSVRKSWRVPTPHVDGRGYVEGVLRVMEEVERKGAGAREEDLVVPMHEEIFYLAEACWFGGFVGKEKRLDEEEEEEEVPKDDAQRQPETSDSEPHSLNSTSLSALRTRLLAPPFPTLIMLHNKHTFSLFLRSLRLDHPLFRLIPSKSHLLPLLDGTSALHPTNPRASFALKPVFGRACSNVYHLHPLPDNPAHEKANQKCLDEIDINPDNHYLAQEWVEGERFCTYAVVRMGKVLALGVYPVRDTIDGSSCVYFEAVENPRVKAYVERVVEGLGDVGGVGWQIALDIVVETRPGGRVMAIECNPRATSGIHLFSGTARLAEAIASCANQIREQPTSISTPPSPPPPSPPPTENTIITPSPRHRRQLAPGMLMWKPASPRNKLSLAPRIRQYTSHMARLMGCKDVMFSANDLLPSLMQPFLLTSYYEICRERRMKLPEMFQWDLTWEPVGEQIRALVEKARNREKRQRQKQRHRRWGRIQKSA